MDKILKICEWVFSGIGVFILGLLLKRTLGVKNIIKKNSKGIQAGGDVNINSKNNDKEHN